MRAFCRLYEQLDRTTATGGRVQLLAAYFATAVPVDAAWALHCLLGRQRRRLITGRRLRQICLEGCGLPAWLVDDCHAQVGDSAETVALLWNRRRSDPADGRAAEPLHVWMEQILPPLATVTRGGQTEDPSQAAAVQDLWCGLDRAELLVVNKLLSGGFRVGVGPGLVLQALAASSGLEVPLLQHRLMGGFVPSAAAWRDLLAPPGTGGPVASCPYPFFLASPLEQPDDGTAPLPGPPDAWLVEWKWDGIRGQLIHRAGQTFLWSRGEELINPAFPELVAAAASALPGGTVLDGEVLVWPSGATQPAPFHQLQRRLGRKAPAARLLADCPAAFVAYDLLEMGSDDWRQRPLSQRRAALQELLATPSPLAQDTPVGRLRLSPALSLASWDDLEPLRQQAAAAGAEGLMLKDLGSAYQAGRRRGSWWKHKREPYTLDAVLLYAQAGSGRRANLYTDYTFGLWDGDPAAEGGLQLVPFAKAYSGLDDDEIRELDRWIRRHTRERFGPVRAVEPLQVFELAFEGLQPSGRHRSGIAVRFPRIGRWRRDKPVAEADSLASARALLEHAPDAG
jgi:DNA ligase-1